ncbi:hypothetical protein [Candidatus Poriferisodalis sp.]|uniref:hypothetical protein n=1 Tax=Candidatus Poriferisodalis sp. TaxID=3101277 RepID=UPI003B527A32
MPYHGEVRPHARLGFGAAAGAGSAGVCCRCLNQPVLGEATSENGEIPEAPDAAPPAILFCLSYQPDENHRSGYRPGDDRERIVGSVRGWWELDPDEVKNLNVKYAVAFHRGVTRSVVEIDGWKWQDVPSSDHNGFDADEDGYPYHDDRWRGRDDVRWCFTPRAAKSSRAANVAKYVEEAWIGTDGKRVPVSPRDTIVGLLADIAHRQPPTRQPSQRPIRAPRSPTAPAP